jgi:hypothetical protein
MRRNPALRVYIMGGVYDLATPFAGAEFDISHLYLSERLRRNVQFSWYESGHMTFVDEKVIPVMASDLARFYASPPDRAALGVEQAGLVRGDEQGGGDLSVGNAQAHQPEDLAFAARLKAVRFCARHRQPSIAMATSDSRTRSTSTEQAWNSFRARVAERSPGHRGGETVLPGAPPLTRLATCPGAVCGRAYLTACPDRSAFQRGKPIFSAESTLF